MTMEELWAAIASDVAEELKTLREVILMKPSQGKDPMLDPKKDPDDGCKRPIGGGDVTDIPIYTCGGPKWEDFEWAVPDPGKECAKELRKSLANKETRLFTILRDKL
jgi:hypothetical protein